MNQPLSRSTAPHYVWGQGCDGWHLEQSETLSVIEERMPPGSQEVRHSHGRARQVFYTLEGTLTLELSGVPLELGPGHSLSIAPGCPHQAMNVSDSDVRFLVISTPPAQGDRQSEPPV
ncbi:cupin domain-containing protein [Shimia ponticola]|uniref:cupin domain-containing protein n=1 Tax=Shimia ponticola TaxID=2582893 RepID=UPI0011BDB7BE|nr:cupin domain-containing protein [Shimia ponticola]